MDQENLGRRIREARKARDLSQEALAREAGVSLNLVNKLERGIVTDPHYSTLSSLARALELSVENLVRGGEPAPLGDAPRSPRITSEDIERQARSGVGYGKLALWRQQIEGSVRDRRKERQTGVVARKAGWALPTETGGKPTWQEAVTIGLEDPVVRAAWVELVRQEQARMHDEMKDYGIRGLMDNLLTKDPGQLRGEELENYTEAAKLAAALLDLSDLVIEIEREDIDARVDEAVREARKRELGKLMFGPIQGNETA